MCYAEKFILKVGGRVNWIFLVQFGEWFNIKPSRAGSLILNHFEKSSLILNHSGEIV